MQSQGLGAPGAESAPGLDPDISETEGGGVEATTILNILILLVQASAECLSTYWSIPSVDTRKNR